VFAGPRSSIDISLRAGEEISIEERDGDEVRRAGGTLITVPGTPVRNPAFDVTPADLITGFVTEEGVIAAPFTEALAATSFTEALAAAVTRRAQRRVDTPRFADLAASAAGSGS
jgi:methylthioribose-1-phosphate isomerase